MSRSLTGLRHRRCRSLHPEARAACPSPRMSKALPSSVSDPLTKRTLVIGRGISIQTVTNAGDRWSRAHSRQAWCNGVGDCAWPSLKARPRCDVQVAGTFDGTLTGRRSRDLQDRKVLHRSVQALAVENGGQVRHGIVRRVGRSRCPGLIGPIHHAHNLPSAKLDNAPSSTDSDKAALVRKKLGIDGLNVTIPPEFDDEAFSRQVLGLPD